MITLKLHQLLQALDFERAKSIEDNQAIFESNVTLKVLHTPDGDLALYAWMADSPESGSVKLESEIPESLLADDELEGGLVARISSLDDDGIQRIVTDYMDPDEVFFVPHEGDEERDLHPEFVEYYNDMARNDA